MNPTYISPEFARQPDAMSAVEMCRWQTHALTDFTLGALMHENPYLWVDETAPAAVGTRTLDVTPVAGQAIAVTAQHAQNVQTVADQALDEARRIVDAALTAEDMDHVAAA